MKSRFNALTTGEIIIVGLLFLLALYITIPVVNMTRPTTTGVKYACMYLKLQENALKVIDSADYEEHYTPFKLATVSGNEMCNHISQQFDTKGPIQCNGEGSSSNPNFYVRNKTAWWGFGGQDFKVPVDNFEENCSNPDSGYTCYKTIYVDLNGNQGVNKLGTDVFRIRLRFDGKVDTIPQWVDENALLESL